MFASGSLAGLSTDRLEEEIVDLAARIASATCRWLLLIAEFERRGAHEEWGFRECSGWLAWRCSLAARSAREHLRVARVLAELPRIREAMSRGELSYSKVRVLTRVATPELEAELVELARHATAAQLERIAGSFRRVLNAADAERVYERRFLSFDWEEDGSLSVQGSLAPEDGALLLRALEAGRGHLREANGGETPPMDRGSAEPPAEPVNADALVLMAETMLAGGPHTRGGGDRAHVVVHVDAAALVGDGDPSRGGREPVRCELDEGARISPETARRVSCDATRTVTRHGPDGPVDVGRRSRTAPAAIRRAIDSRDGGCRFPGCGNRRWTDAHHIVHWADGGATSVDNLVLLCRRHHRLVHEGGFRVACGRQGELRFHRPDGTAIESSPPLARRRGAHALRAGPLRPTQRTPVPLSAGERLDLDLTITAMIDRTLPASRGP